jgi:hypothetical protein
MVKHCNKLVKKLKTIFLPTLYWNRYRILAKKAEIKNLYLVISFDCDTPEDAEKALSVDRKLRKMGINAMYAVPGQILEENANIYLKLFRRGAEFLNHGYKQHTFWNKKKTRYESCFFYDHLSLTEVRKDIIKGHQTVKKVLGISPHGFRTPHFGTFQTKEQLSFLHRVLNEIGYVYSSSTVPYYAFKYGPVFKKFGLLEFPVTGTYSKPFQIQDSWSFFKAPDRTWKAEDYLTQANLLANFCINKKMTGILNYYADISHIWNQPTFFKTVKLWGDIAKSIQLGDIC